MSRKSRRNTMKNAAKAERVAAPRPPYGTLGLSSLALGSMAIAGAAHAQSATANGKSTDTTKAKSAPSTRQAKSLRTKAVRIASSGALPANGAGLVAQNTQAAAGSAAQTQTTAAPSGESANALQEIVVTGIRGSLQRALQIKEMSLGVVDAISAEDIGQFPDASVGAAIGRIPGVTVNRGSINQMSSAGAPTATGDVTGITVRGFGVQFNELLAGGRPLASGNGQNIDYSALGANYVGEVDVLKTPDYSLSGGAIGATINIKYPLPFDNPGFHTQAFFAENDYENDGGITPAFGALISDTFADGKFGILLDGDYTEKHILGHHMDIVGWEATKLSCSQYATGAVPASCGGGAASNPNYSWFPQDMAMYYERTDSRRKDGRAALQWRPNDNVVVTFDDNYSSDDEQTDRWQFSSWFGSSGLQNVIQDGNGTITSFNQGSSPTDFNAFIATDYITTNTPGLNVVWDVNDEWTAEFDADQSVSKLNPNGGYTDVDSDDGYGPNTAVGTNGYVGGAVTAAGSVPYWSAIGPGANVLTGPTTTSNFLGLNPYIIGSHVQVLQDQQNSDKINQVKLQATWHAGDTKVNFGAQFVEETWNSKEMDTLTNNYWQLWSGYGPASNNYEYYCQQPVTNSNNAYGNSFVNSAGATVNTCGAPYSQTSLPPGGAAITVLHGVSLPSSFFTAINFSNFIPGYGNNSHLPPGLLLYNPWSVYNYLEKQPINQDFAPSAGNPPYTGGVPAMAINPSTVQHIDRPNYAPFITAEHNFELSGGMELKADVGLRYERTNVTVAGLNATIQSLGTEPGDKTAYAFNLNPSQWTVATNSYNYFLPSLDLNLMVTPQIKVRADFSRSETEPQNNLIIPSVGYTGRVNSLQENVANPYLLPYLSDNFDLGAEWYYGSNDYLSADAYFKHVTQFPTSTSTTVTIPGITATAPIDPNYNQLAQWEQIKNVNGNAANVTGIEATWQQMLMYGFGFQINGTYVHTNKNFDASDTSGPQFALPGIGNSANIVAFYEGHGLQARIAYQWQATQLLQLGQEQPTGAFGINEPVYLDSSTELDFSSTYDVTKYLAAYFEAMNLTDQVYHTRGRWDNQTLNLVDYGRSFTMGLRLKF